MPAVPARVRAARHPRPAGQARLTLAELDTAIGTFIRDIYNLTPHSETGMAPQQRWEAGAFIPRMPDSLEQLDLLLLTVAKPRKIHPDGIHFQGLRYLDPVLAAYVGDGVTIRYDPRDMAEIRVFADAGFSAGRSAPSSPGRPSASRTSPRPATPAGAAWPGACASGPASWTGFWPPTRNSNRPAGRRRRTKTRLPPQPRRFGSTGRSSPA